MTYCENKKATSEERDQQRAKEFKRSRSDDELRYKNWAFIEKTKELSESEMLKQIVIPSEYGKEMDKRCLIYQNTKSNQATFICPDVSQEDLAPIGED